MSNCLLGPKGGELRGCIQENLAETHACFAQCITYYLSHDKEDPQMGCIPTWPRSDYAENSITVSGMDDIPHHEYIYNLCIYRIGQS